MPAAAGTFFGDTTLEISELPSVGDMRLTFNYPPIHGSVHASLKAAMGVLKPQSNPGCLKQPDSLEALLSY